jgi:hypothetical protein
MDTARRLGNGGKGPKGRELVMASKNRRLSDLFADVFSAFAALLFGTQMELKPIPVKVRRRR